MPVVEVGDVRPGDVLSDSVCSPRGVLLAAAGTVLREAHIELFATWGVHEVDIVPNERTGAKQPDPAHVAEVRALLDRRFSLVESPTPYLAEVRRVAEDILLRRPRSASGG